MSGSKEGEGTLLGGGARAWALGGGPVRAGCVVVLGGGTGRRVGAGVGHVVAPVMGTSGQVGAGTWGGVAANTLCDRSCIAALMGASVPSSAGPVARVATEAWILPSWVVMVSSLRVMDARALRAEEERGTRIVSPSESSAR